MRLVEQDQRREFLAILQQNGLPEDDFEIREIDTTDPKGDEIYGIQGAVSITRRSTGISKEYPIGYDTEWVSLFKKNLEMGEFG
ncbi:hypothetical protein PTE30175_00525 [Pandoraea terrae]|uniref:Uncharacterized protein n=1 Tax=Pandoraea terrae TaxID=1537710 RepID=A0A5E4S4N3_9BURK|nr:transcriptional regulator [Pandoraea terrae]VVD70163.1 hypothetical protein PTE30175_00525 [Pandoraea terrae]